MIKASVQSLLIGAFLTASTLADTPQTARLPQDTLPAELSCDAIPLGLPPERAISADNALTPQRVALGRRLFFDGRLSADGTISCATCHMPVNGFASPDRVALGVGGSLGRRNSPSVLNRVFGTTFFWDGRAATLEEQALQPIENPLEMATTVAAVLEKIRADAEYPAAFAAAYEDGLTASNLARALASFERVLVSGRSPVDLFQAGDVSALTSQQRRGLWLFESRGQCWQCHRGPNYTDEEFHNSGVSWGTDPADLGRFEITGLEVDRGRFHTPSLRSVALTSPYMHDGSLRTLAEVVAFYSRGGTPNPHLDPILKPLHLSDDDQSALVAFLQALTGTEPPAVDEPAVKK